LLTNQRLNRVCLRSGHQIELELGLELDQHIRATAAGALRVGDNSGRRGLAPN
jgi:hypothetical protein